MRILKGSFDYDDDMAIPFFIEVILLLSINVVVVAAAATINTKRISSRLDDFV